MGDNNKDKKEQVIFKVVYIHETKGIEVRINSNHFPMLTFALKLLTIEIDKKIVLQQIQSKKKSILGKLIIPKPRIEL